jgi:uncharacterized protein YbjT (DUF2867 family)
MPEAAIMKRPSLDVLLVGATGSIGELVTLEALKAGHRVRALVRSARKGRRLPAGVTCHIGDVTEPETLTQAVSGVEAIIVTLGSDGFGKQGAKAVDYGGVRNILTALGDRTPRLALMTAIGVTDRVGDYNRRTHAHDWKRRAERLLRVSGLDYTIVRPGWFDDNGIDDMMPLFLQGDRRHAGDPSDGTVARQTIARVLVDSLTNPAASRKTFELVSAYGLEPVDLTPLFAGLKPDRIEALDGVEDLDNQPLSGEPWEVANELAAEAGRGRERRMLAGQLVQSPL